MKKKMSNWSIAGISIGFLFAVFSSIRYWLLFPDTDKAIVYAIIGILIMCVSWDYNVNIEQNNNISAIENYLADKSIEDSIEVEDIKETE